MNYPDTWPQRNPQFPNSVASRITEVQKEDLYERRITTRDLAKLLNVREKWISELFPGKVKPLNRGKQLLRAVRKEFRTEQAQLAIDKSITIDEAAVICRTSYRTMARAVQVLRLETL